MPKILIKGTEIDIPSSGASPNWSPAIIEAFKALADAVNATTATYDVPPQVQNIDAFNTGTVNLNNLQFPSSEVRSATIFYAVYRKTEDSGPPDGEEVSEAGTLEISFNNARTSGQKWELVRSGQSDARVDFNITNLGQISITMSALTGVNHSGIVTYRAISILNV